MLALVGENGPTESWAGSSGFLYKYISCYGFCLWSFAVPRNSGSLFILFIRIVDIEYQKYIELCK